MAHEFRLHDVGEGLTEAEIVRWLVPVGEAVAVDQVVVEIETDKAVLEMPSPFAGTVLHHGAAEGERLKVGDVLVVVGEPGEHWPGPIDDLPARAGPDSPPIVGTLAEEAEDLGAVPQRAAAGAAGIKAMPAVRKMARELGVDLAQVRGSGATGRITRGDVAAAVGQRQAAGAPNGAESGPTEPGPTEPGPTEPGPTEAGPTEAGGPARVRSPVLRRLAQQLGVDLATVTGSGTGGRITRDDVILAARRQPPAAAAGRAGDGERRPLSALRRAIAANVHRSWSQIPQVTAFDEVDVSHLLALRSTLRDRHRAPVPIDALVVTAVVPALRQFPELNATVDGDDLVVHRRLDIGIAVNTPDGLLVAVVRDAAAKGVLALGADIVRLGEGARARTLGPDDLSGQTFTVSNIGAVGGGGHGTPIVPVGTTAILSVGRVTPKPVARDGAVVVAPVMPLSLSYDHRAIDGALGRRFLAAASANLADPALCLA